MANLMLTVMGAFSEFERALIRERQREGISLARKRGCYRGRKPALSKHQAQESRCLAGEGAGKATLAGQFRISRRTGYACLKQEDGMETATS